MFKLKEMPGRAIVTGGLLLLLHVSCRETAVPELRRQEEAYCLAKEFKDRIRLHQTALSPVTEGIHLMGSVEANPDKVVSFTSLVSGLVTSVSFSLGDSVKKGQVMMEMQSVELSALQAQAVSAEARIAAAERRLQSVQSMYNDGVASDKELAEARADLEILRSEKSRIASDLNLYSANREKGVFQIKAPASGVIVSKGITPGMQVSIENGPLFTIASLDNVWVLANVYASNLQNVEQGMEVEITTLSYPDEVFRGIISVLPQVMDQEEKVLKARIEIANTPVRLKPGMLVDVMVMKKKEMEAVAVPSEALVFSDNENYVLVYKDDCHVEIRKVAVMAKNNGTIYLESGLKDGETIITQNQLLIFEQLKNMEK